MNTKIQLKSNNYQSFGGFFYVNDELKRLSFEKVINTHLVLRGIKALSIPNKSYTNQSKTANYEFNTADTVNELLLKLLLQTNQLSTGVGYTLDFARKVWFI